MPPFHVMDLLAAAHRRQPSHGDLVNFVAGQPSTGAPKAGARGGEAAARRGGARLHRRHRRTRAARGGRRPPPSYGGIDVTLDDVVITTGSSGGFLLAFLAAFEAGDRVVMARPGYACYRNVLTRAGLRGRSRSTAGPRRGSSRPSRSSRRSRARSPGWWSPRRPTRPARCCCPTSSPRSRAGARPTACDWSATRSTTASSTACRGREPSLRQPRARASCSARSASTSR